MFTFDSIISPQIGVYSALAWLALGTLMLLSPKKNITALVPFFVVVGVQTALINTAQAVSDAQTSLFLRRIQTIFIVLEPAMLFYYVSSTKDEDQRRSASSWLFMGTLGFAILAATLILLSPDLLIPSSGPNYWGALAPFVLHLPQYVGLSLALLMLARSTDRGSVANARGSSFLFVGIWFSVAYLVFRGVAFLLAGDLVSFNGSTFGAFAYACIFITSAAIVLNAGWTWFKRDAKKRLLWSPVLAFALLWALMAAVIGTSNHPSLAPGLARIVSALLIGAFLMAQRQPADRGIGIRSLLARVWAERRVSFLTLVAMTAFMVIPVLILVAGRGILGLGDSQVATLGILTAAAAALYVGLADDAAALRRAITFLTGP